MFKIRPATPSDVPSILHLIRQLAIYEKLEHEVIATEESLKQNIFYDGRAHVLLAYENETPVGFALYFYNFSTFVGKPGLYLEDLFVEESHRGKGYGKKLFLELVKIAKQNHCGRMEWVALEWNTPAINFYKSMLAQPQNEWTIFRLTEKEILELTQSKS